ncbi:MAG: DUF3106 domain-containing protein [Acidovorax sp.]|uniref:DUF3106 domain-containing protein n=1 Tax=Acidovorax sp. TaxID=1872122 RepID=UPI0039E69B67
MHPRPTDASPALPATVLALVLLGVLAAVGGQVVGQMRMAPSTVLQAGAEAAVASPNNARTPAAPGASAAPSAETGPGWATLTTPQKLALYPLAERWAFISEAQKRRWLALAATFPALPPEEQAKFHERMTDWASLSAQQRNQARLNYAVTNRLAPDDKRAQWEAYLALSEEEKRALAARAAPKPKGAAVALRPVPQRKLAQVPAATQAMPGSPNVPKIIPADHGARVAAPVHINPASAPAPAHAPASAGAESMPVAVPTAVPAALPPLGAGPAAESAPPVTPDNSGLYPQ